MAKGNSKLKTQNLPADALPSVDLSPERWDNRDPFTDLQDIFRDYLADLEKIETAEEALKAKVKGHQAAKKDLRRVLSGRLGIDIHIIDEAERLANMSDEEREDALEKQSRAMVLACQAKGVAPPAAQPDFDEIWGGMTDPGPVADNAPATAG